MQEKEYAELNKLDLAQEELRFLYQKEKELERSLEIVREKIREEINRNNLNKATII